MSCGDLLQSALFEMRSGEVRIIECKLCWARNMTHRRNLKVPCITISGSCASSTSRPTASCHPCPALPFKYIKIRVVAIERERLLITSVLHSLLLPLSYPLQFCEGVASPGEYGELCVWWGPQQKQTLFRSASIRRELPSINRKSQIANCRGTITALKRRPEEAGIWARDHGWHLVFSLCLASFFPLACGIPKG